MAMGEFQSKWLLGLVQPTVDVDRTAFESDLYIYQSKAMRVLFYLPSVLICSTT